MKKTFSKPTQDSATSTTAQPMFRSASNSGWAERTPPFFQSAPAPLVQTSTLTEPVIQRDPTEDTAKKEEEKDPLTEGLKTVGEQLIDDPKFKTLYEPRLDWLKHQLELRLWDQQPPEGKAALISFIAANLGIAGAAFAASPEIRKMLVDVNIGKPLSWIPYSPVESFKYTLPEPGKPKYGFSADLTLNPYLESVRKRNPFIPGVNFGLDTAYDPSRQNFSLTGGRLGLDWLDGGLKAEGKTFTELSSYPTMTPSTMPGMPPSTLMQSVPGMPPTQTGPGWQLMVTADMFKIFPDLAKIF